MPTVRIPRQNDNGWLGFDLAEVMGAVGDHGALAWTLTHFDTHCDVRDVWREGTLAVERRSEEPGGLRLTWQEMERLAGCCDQIIWGDFIGYREDGSAELALVAFDSSFWLVWADDETVLERVRAVFVGVEDDEEPDPPDRR